MSRPLAIIACGGTGGHLTPGIALAERLDEHGVDSLLLTSRKKVDARLLEKYPALQTLAAPGAGLAWTPRDLFRFAATQAQAVLFARRLFRTRRPAVFVSFGGFLTLGPALAGRLAGVPVVLHEANRVPGKAVRLLSRLATRVWLPPGVPLPLRPGVLRHAGLPVRKEFAPLPRAEARRALGFPETGRMLLVFGGSQGSGALNVWLAQCAPQLRAAGIHVLCVSGAAAAELSATIAETSAASSAPASIAAATPHLRVIPFCDKMPEALSAADLVVARAGAASIAEFTACGVPSVLVPYPFAADNHQEANARHLAALGGARLVPQERLSEETPAILRLLADSAALDAMRAALRAAREAFDWHPMLADILTLAGIPPPSPPS